jgi:hypothetical protein
MAKTAVAFKPVLRNVVFRFDGRRVPNEKSVILVGSFNRWDTSVDHLTPGPDRWWTTSVLLGPGEYPYLFIVDGSRGMTRKTADGCHPSGVGSCRFVWSDGRARCVRYTRTC